MNDNYEIRPAGLEAAANARATLKRKRDERNGTNNGEMATKKVD